MKILKYSAVIVAIGLPCLLSAAPATKKQSAIQDSTTVRSKTTAKGIYSQDCYDEYYGCMDQFCISENENGGSCTCSNKYEKYESELAEINKVLAEADRIKTVEVEKVKLGANADIVFNGERKYDKNGNVIRNDQVRQSIKKAGLDENVRNKI